MRFHVPASIATNPRYLRHRYAILIVLVIVVALGIVAVSMWLYRSSGAAQLDLSRPGYQSIRSKTNDDEFKAYPSTGTLDKPALDEFEAKLNERSKQLLGDNAFSRDVLDDDALSINAEGVPVITPSQRAE